MTDAEAELRALGAEPVGIVRVAAFQSAIHSLVVPAVAALRQLHPAVAVHVEELEPHASTPALLRGDVDLAITATDFVDAPLRPDIAVVPLTTDPIVLVAPAGHPAGRHERVELATLADEDWTVDLPDSYMANLTTRLCRQAGFEPRVVCRFTTYLITLQHVEAGGSIALLPELAVDRRYDVLTRELNPATQRRITAAVRTSSIGRAAVQVVMDGVRRQAARQWTP